MKRVVGLVFGLSLVVPVLQFETGLVDRLAGAVAADRAPTSQVVSSPGAQNVVDRLADALMR